MCSPDLILLAALDQNHILSVGAQIARRTDTNSAKGRTYVGIVASLIFNAQNEIPIAPDDVLLPPRRLDFNTLKLHKFFESNSTYGNFNYRMIFEAGDKRPRSIRLPAPFLFKVSRNGWSFSEDVLGAYLASEMPGNSAY